MPYEAVSRYPSRAFAHGEPDHAVMIDGLDVVDEQVVVLAPAQPADARRRPRRRGGPHGVG